MHLVLNLIRNANSKQYIDVLDSEFRTAVTMVTTRDIKQMARKSATSSQKIHYLFLQLASVTPV